MICLICRVLSFRVLLLKFGGGWGKKWLLFNRGKPGRNLAFYCLAQKSKKHYFLFCKAAHCSGFFGNIYKRIKRAKVLIFTRTFYLNKRNHSPCDGKRAARKSCGELIPRNYRCQALVIHLKNHDDKNKE